jgi:hypothetical protein
MLGRLLVWYVAPVPAKRVYGWVQTGPVFVSSAAEKVSGGVFAIGHVVEKEAVAVGWRSCCLCWSFVFIRAKEEAVSKGADAT